ncbi:hypothetical protein FS320_37905 [Microvirga tunisiensis]|uniref:Uncharacterized protein n=2 Tax=Microvirga tunisiensis TaxID=2108360 RepID=A0A5N7MUF4_9HYPH|nr:hypothetical protein [Microvirga tunisiensis]MPR30613.1 hypothetical protein [Microvirga tunisiensis]
MARALPAPPTRSQHATVLDPAKGLAQASRWRATPSPTLRAAACCPQVGSEGRSFPSLTEGRVEGGDPSTCLGHMCLDVTQAAEPLAKASHLRSECGVLLFELVDPSVPPVRGRRRRLVIVADLTRRIP